MEDDGDIFEYTTYYGQIHGIWRHIGSSYITVRLYCSGETLASLIFTPDFEELTTSSGLNYGRTDPDGYFDELLATDFQL